MRDEFCLEKISILINFQYRNTLQILHITGSDNGFLVFLAAKTMYRCIDDTVMHLLSVSFLEV